jgi:hypothetical protein
MRLDRSPLRILPKVPVPVNSSSQRTFLTPSLTGATLFVSTAQEAGICQGRLKSIRPYRSQNQNRYRYVSSLIRVGV